MEKEIIISVGTLSSWNSLYRNIAPKLDEVREAIQSGEKPYIFWDFSYIQAGRVSMSALTAFLSIAYNIRKSYDKSIPTIMRWDPHMLRFLSDIQFFKVAKDLDILEWHPNLIGGMIDKPTNPSSKILVFNDVPDKSLLLQNTKELNKWKERKREELIIEELYMRIDSLFVYENISGDLKHYLTHVLTTIVAELIVNSLLHGQDAAFVGFQKSTKGVTVCVCDGGQGFLNSITKKEKWANEIGMQKNIDALLNASLMTKDEIGLRRAIDDIVGNDGYIVLSSVDCELRWEKDNWNRANQEFDFLNFKNRLQSAENILGDARDIDSSASEYRKGYYRNFNSKLKGTRITFEVPSKYKIV